jgi:hypothetical protein
LENSGPKGEILEISESWGGGRMTPRADFEKGLREIFTKTSEEKITESSMLVQICLAIYLGTVGKKQEWMGQADLAREVYGEDDKTGRNRGRVRKNIRRIRDEFDQYFEEDKKDLLGFKVSVVDNKTEIAPVRDSQGKLQTAYKFIFTPAKKQKKVTAQDDSGIITSFLDRYVGRTDEVKKFENLLENLDSPKRTQHILSLYGFGGIGKSSLLEIFRDVATNNGINVQPRFARDEFVSKSISEWLSEVLITKHKKPEEMRQEKWRDFLDVLEPRTVVLIDTLATVDMSEFNDTLQSLSAVLKKAKPDCLIVTTTRAKPNHRENPVEIKGLSASDIKDLARVRGWNQEIISSANKLQKHTDGNPLMIECICEDENLWTRFREGSLDLIRHSDPVAFLLREMWELLTERARESLKTAALLSRYANKWKFKWGKDECSGLLGSSWDDTFSELKGKCFIREKEIDVYEMHELISDFAISKIMNKAEEMTKIGDYFSQKGREEIALRFHTEASDAK